MIYYFNNIKITFNLLKSRLPIITNNTLWTLLAVKEKFMSLESKLSFSCFFFEVPLLIVLEQAQYYRWHTAGFNPGFTNVQGHHTLDKQLINYSCFITCSGCFFLFRFKTCLEVNCNVLRLRFVSERYAWCPWYPADYHQ